MLGSDMLHEARRVIGLLLLRLRFGVKAIKIELLIPFLFGNQKAIKIGAILSNPFHGYYVCGQLGLCAHFSNGGIDKSS